ncbi:hypothetical protein D0Y65_035751 [Glycine soja]|uniref:Uncharacterized protein n=2 Tax=Glycine soja TaxID=3848 RepID=A0A445HBE6_GLYSO|nr:hypothetical protein D0Y65_035751 [Glycine soja]
MLKSFSKFRNQEINEFPKKIQYPVVDFRLIKQLKDSRKHNKQVMGLGRLMVTLKSKIRSLKIMKKPDYDKVEKSESMRMEIRSRKARKLIEETLKVADSPKPKAFAF